MKVFRITRAKYAEDLSDSGARLYGGRWNPKGIAILYTAESRALAVLELLVHSTPLLLPEDLKLIGIEIPDELTILTWSPHELPSAWRNYPADRVLAAMGEKWALSGQSLALKVPSVFVPAENNVLINPAHPDFSSIKMIHSEDFQLDTRLL